MSISNLRPVVPGGKLISAAEETDRRLGDSLSSSSEADPCIYFRMLYRRKILWYVINNNSKKTPKPEVLDPVFKSPRCLQTHSTCTSVGSTIYLVGCADHDHRSADFDSELFLAGYCPPSLDKVFYIDTLDPVKVWKRGPSLKIPRMFPYSCTVNDKIYAMGSLCKWHEDCCWAEVYDPLCKEEDQDWLLLGRESNCMPPASFIASGHVVLEGGKRILLHSLECAELYCYNIEADSWAIYDEDLGMGKASSAFIDGVLYFTDSKEPGVLFGVDMSEPAAAAGNHLSRTVRRVVKDRIGGNHQFWNPTQGTIHGEFVSPYAELVSLGNDKLAVVRPTVYYDSADSQESKIHCTKFKMSKVAGEGDHGKVTFVAETLSALEYYVKGWCMLGSVAVFPSQKKDTHEDINKDGNTALTNKKSSTSCSNSNSGNNTHKDHEDISKDWSIALTNNSCSSDNSGNKQNKKKKKKKNKNKNKKKQGIKRDLDVSKVWFLVFILMVGFFLVLLFLSYFWSVFPFEIIELKCFEYPFSWWF